MVFIISQGDNVKINNTYKSSDSRKRGDVIDRNGVIIATDLKTKSLYISTILIKNPAKTASSLVSVFPTLDYQDLLNRIIKNKSSKKWILIKRNLTPFQQNQVRNLKMAGLLFQDDLVRVYPQKSIASHVVGYTDSDRHGLAGIERAYNSELTGGENIQLALDIRVQDVLNNELMKAMRTYRANSASGIIVDVTNGEILALTSLPNFDPNTQNQATPNQRFNRITTAVHEFGSVFKIFTNALAFEENLVKTKDVFDVSESIKYDVFTIRDDHPHKSKMTVEEIFAYSSNVGTVKIAQKFGAAKQKNFFQKLNFLDRLDINFPGLAKPIYPRIWREINLYTISYGHGIAVTALHMASAISAMVNGGILYQPSFVKQEELPKGKRVVSEKTTQMVREIMQNTVIYGTGRNAAIVGYEVGGKTGTAERAELGSYNRSKTLASFAGAFPISKPKYLLFIFFDQPNHTSNTGGMVAAPVAKNIVQNIAPILEIVPKIPKD